MDIYLPIAEMPVDIFVLLALGTVSGVLSGMFGIGGGFLVTPFLIFLGVPPAVSVSSSANQIIATSVSGFMAHVRRGNVDFRMGTLLLFGGMFGSMIGVWIFSALKNNGNIDVVISLCYIAFLSSIGILMGVESSRAILNKKRTQTQPETGPKFALLERLPLKTRFPRSRLYISAILPISVGFFAGIFVSIMGIGGGFLMIPLMIYVLGMPTSVVVGTSLFQIIFITANVTFLQSVQTQTVDVVLALVLLIGSVVGAQFGTRIGAKIHAERLRGVLALLILFVALKLAYGLFAVPADIYSVTVAP